MSWFANKSLSRFRMNAGLLGISIYVLLMLFFSFISPNLFGGFIGFRQSGFYAILAIIIYDITNNETDFKKIVNAFYLSSYPFIILGILQFLYYSSLPDYLLNESGLQSEYDFAFFGLYRVNGTIGNPLVYGNFVILFIISAFIRFNKYHSLLFFLITIMLGIIAIVFSFSRSSWYLLIILSFFYLVLWPQRFTKKIISIPIILFILIIIENSLPIELIIDRFLSRDNSSIASNLGRIEQLVLGYEYFMKKPLLGEGLGVWGAGYSLFSIEYSSKILFTDNYFLKVLLETGIIGFSSFIIATIIPLITFLYGSIKITNIQLKKLLLGITCCTLSTILLQTVSSTLDSRIIACYFWIFIGLGFTLFKIIRNGSIANNEVAQISN